MHQEPVSSPSQATNRVALGDDNKEQKINKRLKRRSQRLLGLGYFFVITFFLLINSFFYSDISRQGFVRGPLVRSHLRTLSYSIFISLYVHTYAAFHIYLTTQSLHCSVVTALHGVFDIYDVTLLEHSLVVVSSIISLPLLVRYVLTL